MGWRIRDAAWRLWAALRRDEGATAVEYALMIALIALVIVAAVAFLGQETNEAYSNETLLTGLGA